ncbi:hypothetical protein [uncultured Mediterranean phage uvDeep-CGR2-KM18-C74]|nr:hypothetical protein [uncultured Mediterranean phage uvDeep-CGR2-KM18-C74]
MSLAIDIEKVERVCVGGYWYDVKWTPTNPLNPKGKKVSTLIFNSYEFITTRGYENKWPPYHLVHGGGDHGSCSEGFQFIDKETGRIVVGPFTSIDAVMY